MIQSWATELRAKQARQNLKAPWTAKRLGTRINTLLMERLQDVLGIEDTSVPDLCMKGISITGRASVSPFFESFEITPTMTREEFLEGCWERSQQMIRRVEVKAGAMGEGMSLEKVGAKYGYPFK